MIVLTTIARQSANADMAQTLTGVLIAFAVAAASFAAFTRTASMSGQEMTEACLTPIARSSGHVGQALALTGRAVA